MFAKSTDCTSMDEIQEFMEDSIQGRLPPSDYTYRLIDQLVPSL